MSEGSKPQAPVPSGRPSGDRRSQRLACMEDSGVRRSGRSRSNVASVSPDCVESRRGRKAESRKTDPSTSSAESGPSGAQRKQSAHGGEADLEEEGWGVLRARESISTYGSRVMSHLREYEDASKTLRRLREELRGLRACIETAPRRKKPGLQTQIKQLQVEIGELEERRTVLREKSGPFKEKLLNEERFQRMAEEKRRRLMGLQPESQVEEDQAVEEDGDGDQQDPPGSLQEQVPYSGPPARQAAMSPSCGSGDEYETCSPGGALMEEIQLLESPVRFQDLCFGDELPPETPGGGKTKKAKKTKPQEQDFESFFDAKEGNEIYVFLGLAPPASAKVSDTPSVSDEKTEEKQEESDANPPEEKPEEPETAAEEEEAEAAVEEEAEADDEEEGEEEEEEES